VKSTISAIGSVSIAILHDQGGFEFDRKYYFDPEYRWNQDQKIARWCEQKYAPWPIYNAEAHLVQLNHLPQAYRQVGGLQPNLILGATLGAEFIFPGNRDPDITPTPLKNLTNLNELKNIVWAETEPLATFLNQIETLKQRYVNQPVNIFPPFFWDRSGQATIHGPLTTALKLLGESFMIAIITNPGFARELLLWITETYKELILLFSKHSGLKITGIHIGECSGSMFSPEQWANFAIPVMNVLAETCGPVRLHSCGHSDHLLETMTQVRNVSCLNIGSGTNISRCRELFGSDVQLDIIPDLPLLFEGTPGEIRNWVKRVLKENQSGPMEIQFHLDTGIPLENGIAIFEALISEGIYLCK
jgi:uroporphyrinogen-III decarboxylase